MGFDTTSSNTGRMNGACRIFEFLLGRDLLHLACRHHIYETVLRGVFDTVMGPTVGPETPLFKRFRAGWPKIDVTKIEAGILDQQAYEALKDDRDEIIEFVLSTLQEKQPRDDYKEFLELTLLFLNNNSTNDLKIRPPGAIHHARWMAKGLYTLKIFLFRKQFSLRPNEVIRLRKISIFLLKIYIKPWFRAPNAVEAPLQDLLFLKSLVEFKKVNEKISEAAIKKFANHLWYLTGEIVVFSLFDPLVSFEMKQKIATALIKEKESNEEEEDVDVEKENETEKRLIIKPKDAEEFCCRELHTFVNKSSEKLFKRLNVSVDFLKKTPSEWPDNEDYQKASNIVKHLKVVNDTAERGIKLITEYNDILTKDEEQKQYVLQLTSDFNKRFPDTKKSTLTKDY